MVGKRGESCNPSPRLSRVNPARGGLMRTRLVSLVLMSVCVLGLTSASHGAAESLPLEPDVSTRVDELYDSESRLYLFLYSLKGDGTVDYITGRFVREQARSEYGNPVYDTERFRCSIGGTILCGLTATRTV